MFLRKRIPVMGGLALTAVFTLGAGFATAGTTTPDRDTRRAHASRASTAAPAALTPRPDSTVRGLLAQLGIFFIKPACRNCVPPQRALVPEPRYRPDNASDPDDVGNDSQSFTPDL